MIELPGPPWRAPGPGPISRRIVGIPPQALRLVRSTQHIPIAGDSRGGGGVYRGMCQPSQTRDHSAEAERHCRSAQSGRTGFTDAQSPLVRNTMKGIRRTLGTAPAQKAATLTDDIRAMLDATDAGTIGFRDRALILLGFAGAFRRSELVGLDVEDCAFGKDGLTVTLRRSKVDQEGVGRKIGIPYGSNPETCPVRTMQTWIEQAAITAGPVFRSINRHGHVKTGRLSGIDVARVVKKLVDRAGLDASQYAGHSLRAGHATSAAIAGASERSIMNQTGHRSVQMVRRYIRDGNLFRENSAGKLGL
jgi:integrase